MRAFVNTVVNTSFPHKVNKVHAFFSDYGLTLQGGSNMTGTDFCVNKPQCAGAVRP